MGYGKLYPATYNLDCNSKSKRYSGVGLWDRGSGREGEKSGEHFHLLVDNDPTIGVLA
jgi:hypothetical protein